MTKIEPGGHHSEKDLGDVNDTVTDVNETVVSVYDESIWKIG